MTLDCTCNRLTEAERKAALWDGIERATPYYGYCHEWEGE